MKISVVINTYNAEQYLEKCLESVVGFDEIVICDMFSSDKTIEIAERFGCTIVTHPHTGIVEPARNFALSKATNDWVLVLDSDEVVPAKLKEYLYEFATTAKEKGYRGLNLTRKNYFMGRFIRSTFPDYILRFMDRTCTNWPSTIHARPEINEGKVACISKDKSLSLIHLPDESISERLAKIDRYSDKDVERRMNKPKYSSLVITSLSALVRFVRNYIIKGGFLDGKPGYIYCKLECHYKFIVLYKIWERKIRIKNR